jgi:hypothetical protein
MRLRIGIGEAVRHSQVLRAWPGGSMRVVFVISVSAWFARGAHDGTADDLVYVRWRMVSAGSSAGPAFSPILTGYRRSGWIDGFVPNPLLKKLSGSGLQPEAQVSTQVMRASAPAKAKTRKQQIRETERLGRNLP